MAISSIGVGSNLPLAELLDNFRAGEQGRLTAIQTRQTGVTARITAYGQLKSELTNVSNASKFLLDKAFVNMKTGVTGTDFTATSTSKAIEGNYNVAVNSLAKTQSLVFSGQASRTDDIGTGGVVSFTVNGEVKQLDLSATGTSLEDIVKAINSDSDIGVQATILNNGSSAPHQLILTSKSTGTDAAVTNISVSGNAQLNDVLNFGAAGSTVQENAATDASFTVNGVAMTSQGNTIEGVIDGVTINLTGASGANNSLNISSDDEGIKKAIQEFVDRFNDVHKKLKQVTNYDTEAKTGSALTGDSIARSIQSRLSSILNSPTSGGAFSMLSEIGIRTDPKTGLLEVDDAKLTKALAEKPADVQNLFVSDTGVAKKAMEVANIFTDPYEGILKTATDGAERSLKDLGKQYTNAESQIDAMMETYRKKFSAMDALVAQMNSTSSYLTQQLANLGTKNS